MSLLFQTYLDKSLKVLTADDSMKCKCVQSDMKGQVGSFQNLVHLQAFPSLLFSSFLFLNLWIEFGNQTNTPWSSRLYPIEFGVPNSYEHNPVYWQVLRLIMLGDPTHSYGLHLIVNKFS